MYKVEHRCYKDEQNNKILSMTVNDVPFMIGIGDNVQESRDAICGSCLDAIHNHFKDYPFHLSDWVNLHTAIGFAVDDLCSLQ